MDNNFKNGFEKRAFGWGSLAAATLGGGALGYLGHKVLNPTPSSAATNYMAPYAPEQYPSEGMYAPQPWEAPPMDVSPPDVSGYEEEYPEDMEESENAY